MSRALTRRAQENVVCAALLVVFGGVIWLTQDFGPRARMIPLPLAIGGIVLTIIQLLWQNLRSTEELQMDMISVAERRAAGGESASSLQQKHDEAQSAWRRELRAYGIVAALIGLVLLIGIMPAVFVFTAAYFLLTRYYSLRAGLVYTSIFTALVYLLFIAALQIQPYHGLLESLVERFR
jgi:hypothetical protein